MQPASHADLRAVLTDLVAFDTTSRNSNLAIIDHLEARLADLGFACRRVPDETGTKANLYAHIGPEIEGGVVLSGHTDVVPVDGQDWASDPWRVVEKDGRLYGRGTADMKGFIACCLALAPEFAAARLARPIILAFSHDEEVGCAGAPAMIARIASDLPRPAACIVGEPTRMQVVSAHKGIRTFEVSVQGREAHSSQTQSGVSAIMAALPLMELIVRMGAEAEAAADPASPFTPPGATMTIGQIEGGTAVNILAKSCKFIWDLRTADEAEADAIEARFRAAAAELDATLKAAFPDAGVIVRRRTRTPALQLKPGNAAEELARALTGDNATRAAAFAAEAGLFQEVGVPTVICGPGDIAQAHQPNEWIEAAELDRCAAFLRRLVIRLSA